jgi:hypothetical protein
MKMIIPTTAISLARCSQLIIDTHMASGTFSFDLPPLLILAIII